MNQTDWMFIIAFILMVISTSAIVIHSLRGLRRIEKERRRYLCVPYATYQTGDSDDKWRAYQRYQKYLKS